ncbi:helix-turn-helix transcriptional regulator [Acidipropionibacterium virtanenii]|uniref:Putative transcriptional regulatory protein NarL n=1 Tax=Acidipropionibacterium virtanenii TaxID=2057246 RepID=A0A344UXB9_9ACTN|nr:helix-turn-helix transcriptional regulator [Acidipropionibacterium virtanenii]AXE39917.1 putative transcriptional regulatory protein NarL [Acidipropionibacterium virtanenii]
MVGAGRDGESTGGQARPGDDELRRVVDLTMRVWYALTPEQARSTYATLLRAPTDVIASDPYLLNAYLLSGHLAEHPATEPDQHALVEMSAQMTGLMGETLKRAGTADEIVMMGSALLIGCRVQGDLDASERAGDAIQQRLDELARQGRMVSPRSSSRPGMLTMQRGLTATLQGDFGRAMRLCSSAYGQMGEPPYRHFAGANAAANAAMLSVLEGHVELARMWLGRLEAFSDRSSWYSYLTYLGEYVARAMLATDRLDRPTAEAALEMAGPQSAQAELWPFIAVARNTAELAFGDPVLAHEQLRAAAFAHNHRLSDSTYCGHILLRAYLNTLVAQGECATAVRLAEKAGDPPRTLVPVARACLRTGRYEDASRLAVQGIRSDDQAVRDIRELRLIRSVALLRAGRSEEAAQVFAVFHRTDDEFTAAMRARIGPQDLADLTSLIDGVDPASPGPVRDGPDAVAASLTTAEMHVLNLLADGRTIAQVAEASFTSPNTVKTHVSAIYRKLGVTKRADALWKAEQLGLL